jgi:tRNA nucleotidyltransferase (CCA-adding enzyme)
MKTYLVGGAVRDKLLNRPVTERDWVVLGETPESMLQQGFRAVGKDFPVFLHPKTNEEYALARTERKTAKGYKGFSVDASPDVSLEQDLLRRDLTINAIAMTEQGELIDPYGGQRDLENRIFRHVSPAFSEDPVRILRLARFAARYAPLCFTIADETHILMCEMVEAGEVDALVSERIWAETVKSLGETQPSAFFYTLKNCGALAKIFPEIHALFGVPQPENYHPEIDCGVHSLMALEQAALLSPKLEVRFAALVHDLGKAVSPKDNLPHHYGHELKGVPIVEQMCNRLRIPNDFKKLALHVTQYHTHCHKVRELRATTLVDLLQSLGGFKPENNLQDFILACEADARGRLGFENTVYAQADFIKKVATYAANIDTADVLNLGLEGKAIGEAIRRLRVSAVNEFLHQQDYIEKL